MQCNDLIICHNEECIFDKIFIASVLQTQFFDDQRAEGGPWPRWLDTVGMDEALAKKDNKELAREYLKELQNSGRELVHAVVWFIPPSLGGRVRKQTKHTKKMTFF